MKAFGLPNCVRISTGTDAENQRCMEAIEQVSAIMKEV
jgi:histidinol-phosphate/aromatic aminotransferase/cobyric acid decarboxylase-like protein